MITVNLINKYYDKIYNFNLTPLIINESKVLDIFTFNFIPTRFTFLSEKIFN